MTIIYRIKFSVFIIFRNLIILGFEGDPGWDAINSTYKYIKDQLILNREDHIAAESIQLDAEAGNVMKN